MISSPLVNAHGYIDKWLSRPHRGRVARLLAFLGLLFLASALPADAHPYDPGYYSLRSALRVDSIHGLQAMAVAEVPNTDMLQAFVRRFGLADEYEQEKIDSFIASYFDRLAEGLAVEVRGETLAGRWEPVDDPRNGRVGEQGLFIFMVEFVPETPPALEGKDVEVVVHVTAFEGEEAFFSASVEALDPWQVLESSARELLGEVSGSEDVNECFECWSRDESLRHSRAVFGRSRGSETKASSGEVSRSRNWNDGIKYAVIAGELRPGWGA